MPHFRCEVGEQAKSLFQDRAAWKLPSPRWWPSPRGGKTKENPNLSPLTLSLSFSYQPDQICYRLVSSLLLKQSLPFTHTLWIKDGKLFPFSKDSISSLKSKMASYSHFLRTVCGLSNQGWQAIPTFWGQYLVFEMEDGSYSHFLRSVCDLISKHGWLLAAVGFWGKKMSGWGVEGSVVVLLILALLLILPLILLLVVLLVLLMVRGWGQHGRTQESQVSLGSHEGRGLLSSSVGMF